MTATERLLELNRKILADEPVTDEEFAEVISGLRGDRMSAAGKGTKNPALAALPDNLNDLFK